MNFILKSFFAVIFLTFSFSQIEDGCDLPDFNLYLTDSGEVFYNSSADIGGFQFNVDGANVLGTGGGAAADNGFTVSSGNTTVLAFSFTGGVIPAGCGTLVYLDLDGDATGLSGIIISDSSGGAIDFEYYEGGDIQLDCEDPEACNFLEPGECEYADYVCEDGSIVCDENECQADLPEAFVSFGEIDNNLSCFIAPETISDKSFFE